MHQEINPVSSFKSIQNQIFFTTSTATLLIQATISQASLPQYLASTFSSEPQISSLYSSQIGSCKNLGLIMSLLSSKSSTTLHFTQWEKVLMVGLQFPLWVHSCCFLSAPQPSCCYLNSPAPRALTLAVFSAWTALLPEEPMSSQPETNVCTANVFTFWSLDSSIVLSVKPILTCCSVTQSCPTL